MSTSLNDEQTQRIVRALWKWINILDKSANELSRSPEKWIELIHSLDLSHLTRQQVKVLRSALYQTPADAHVIAICLRQIDQHIKALMKSQLWRGELAKRGQNFRSIFGSNEIVDLRDVIEHSADYLTGSGRKPELFQDPDQDWPAVSIAEGQALDVTLFGRRYNMLPSITAATELAKALPKSGYMMS